MEEALRHCSNNPDAILDAANLFIPENVTDKVSVIKQLVLTFGTDPDEKNKKISF